MSEMENFQKTGNEIVKRELALIKVRFGTSDSRRGIMDLISIFKSRILEIGLDSMIIEVTGNSDKIEAFVNILERYEIVEISRTGSIFLTKCRNGYELAPLPRSI
jgi:acetolactate synthase-1/3 small subunit